MSQPVPAREYFVFASSLPLRRYGATVRFFRRVTAIRKQLAVAEGLIGYSLQAKPLARRYYTLSVWASEEAMDAFVRRDPHRTAMAALTRDMAPTRFERWTVRGEAMPTWDEALRRLSSEART